MGSSEEDKQLWKQVSSGRLEMMVNHCDGANFFEVGKEYYLDFTEATYPTFPTFLGIQFSTAITPNQKTNPVLRS